MVVKCDNCGNRYEWDKSNKCPFCGTEYNREKEGLRVSIMIFLSIPVFVLLTSIPEILDRYFLNPNKYDGITLSQWKRILPFLIFIFAASFINAFRFFKYTKTRKNTKPNINDIGSSDGGTKNGNTNKY